MVNNTSRGQGFTYLMLLWWVAVSSVLVAALGQSWAIEARRQREMELVFRGEQIRAALLSYHLASPDQAANSLPLRLDDLLEDRRDIVVKRHLRRLWPDPITGSADWGLVRQGDGIMGVYSASTQAPLRAPTGISSYNEWRFEADVSSVNKPSRDVPTIALP